ncbi:MAG: hypothetical protein IKK83_00525 [Clostridia bacterium]|nr:hypothetical protein [Clostridia bacterium]
MKAKDILKAAFFMLLPLSLFLLLLYPYSLINQAVIVDWLGCGCPKVSGEGEMIHDYFSANDFTRAFWGFIAVCATALAVIPARRFLKGRALWQTLYIVALGVLSLFIAAAFTQSMMWN